jgi:hypothetical protein
VLLSDFRLTGELLPTDGEDREGVSQIDRIDFPTPPGAAKEGNHPLLTDCGLASGVSLSVVTSGGGDTDLSKSCSDGKTAGDSGAMLDLRL